MSDQVITTDAEPSLPASTPVPVKRSAGRPPHDDDPRTTRYLILTMRQQAIMRGNGWRDSVLARYRVDRIEAMPRQALLTVLTVCEAPEALYPAEAALWRWADRKSCHTWARQDLLDAINGEDLASGALTGAILSCSNMDQIEDMNQDMAIGMLAAMSAMSAFHALKAIDAEAALEKTTQDAPEKPAT